MATSSRISRSKKQTIRRMKRGKTAGQRKYRFFSKKNRFYWLVGLFFTLAFSVIFYFDFAKYIFRENLSSTRTYIARVDFRCLDIEKIKQEQNIRANRVPPVFRRREGWVASTLEPFNVFVLSVRKDTSEGFSSSKKEWEREYKIPFPAELARFIVKEPEKYKGFYAAAEEAFKTYRGNIVPDEYRESEELTKIIIFESGPNNRKRTVIAQSLPRLDEMLRGIQEGLQRKYGRKIVDPFLVVIGKHITPSLEKSEELIKALQEKEKDTVKDIYKVVKKDAVIVREGKRITPARVVELEQEQRTFASSLTTLDKLQMVGGHITFALSLVILVGVYMYFFEKGIKLSKTKIFIYFIFVMLFVIVSRVMSFVGFPPNAVPIVFVGMVTAIVINLRFAVVIVFILSLITGYIFRVNVDHSIALFAGGMIGVFFCSQLRRRIKILEGGFIAGLVNVAVNYGIAFSRNISFTPVWLVGVVGMSSGVGSAILLIGLLPLIEYIFDTTTDIRLLELSDQGHPLLRNLFLMASGTYTHSLGVGNLAESAAEGIGANPLLARVASYYHDIGKIFKPEYYIENQTPGRNKHDGLKPSLSSLIIASHTRDGIDLAKEYNLPQPILDIIVQHHGTGKIVFFLQKAQAAASKNEHIDEQYYRYPGPKPYSKEAGIVLLADAVEAASRTLSSPSPQSLRKTVERIITGKIEDDQLDDTGLTMVELSLIKESFITVLYGIFHTRIEYPEEQQ
ncbi:HD family phosphohydrolase [Planctomycetota bacterium]